MRDKGKLLLDILHVHCDLAFKGNGKIVVICDVYCCVGFKETELTAMSGLAGSFRRLVMICPLKSNMPSFIEEYNMVKRSHGVLLDMRWDLGLALSSQSARLGHL